MTVIQFLVYHWVFPVISTVMRNANAVLKSAASSLPEMSAAALGRAALSRRDFHTATRGVA